MFKKNRPYIIRRLIAGLIDYGLIYIINVSILVYISKPDENGEHGITAVIAIIPILVWFIMTVAIETSIGATLGNLIVNLKPLPISGENRKLTLGESLKRHIGDPFDMFLFGIVGIMTIINSKQNQRVGDFWANTIVVKNRSL
jgi:uncharacterized RDD family membrane protein YckC